MPLLQYGEVRIAVFLQLAEDTIQRYTKCGVIFVGDEGRASSLLIHVDVGHALVLERHGDEVLAASAMHTADSD